MSDGHLIALHIRTRASWKELLDGGASLMVVPLTDAEVFGHLFKRTHASAVPAGSTATAAQRTDPEARIAHALGLDPERLSGC